MKSLCALIVSLSLLLAVGAIFGQSTTTRRGISGVAGPASKPAPSQATSTMRRVGSLGAGPASKPAPSQGAPASAPASSKKAGAIGSPVQTAVQPASPEFAACSVSASVTVTSPAANSTITGTPDSNGYISVPYNLTYTVSCSTGTGTGCTYAVGYTLTGPTDDNWCATRNLACGASNNVENQTGNWLLLAGSYKLVVWVHVDCSLSSTSYASTTVSFTVKKSE
jgi:hypothetical protein